MKAIYKIEFVKPFSHYKVGEVSTKFSRDNANSLVNELGVAKFYIEKKATKKKEKK